MGARGPGGFGQGAGAAPGGEQGAVAVERYLGPEYRRLLAAARRSLERTGGVLTGRISVADPDDAERKAIIGITGVHQSAGTKRLTVSLEALIGAVLAHCDASATSAGGSAGVSRAATSMIGIHRAPWVSFFLSAGHERGEGHRSTSSRVARAWPTSSLLL
jgi:hypothetical protein